LVTAVDGSPFILEKPHFALAATQPLLEQLVATLRRAE
jgi:hypothetical protein